MNKLDIDIAVKNISSEVYKFAQEHKKRLVPTTYKTLFKKIAKKLGFKDKDLEMFDSGLFVENQQKTLETKRSEDLSKVHSSISEKVKQLLSATSQYSNKIKTSKKLSELSNETIQYLSKLNQTKERLKGDEKILNNIADMIFKDPLTGLLNRRFMNMVLKREFYRLKRYSIPLSVMIADIDRFKNVNDTYGHISGDIVLSNIAELLRDSSRSSDTAVRYGGEEMIVICPATNREQAMILAEKFRYCISKLKFQVKEKLFSVTASFGVTECKAEDEQDEIPVKALERMDRALYQSKKNGRNKVTAL